MTRQGLFWPYHNSFSVTGGQSRGQTAVTSHLWLEISESCCRLLAGRAPQILVVYRVFRRLKDDGRSLYIRKPSVAYARVCVNGTL